MINFDDHQCALMYIPADTTMEIENHLMANGMNKEGMGMMAKEILGVPLTLMTECSHEHNDVLEVTVYHLGQDGEYVCLNCYDPELHGLSIYPMASCLNMEATTNE